MASLVQELLIKIGIKSDTAQGKDAAASVERIGNAVKATAPEMQKAGTASKDMARGLGEGAAVGNATVAAMTNLAAASEGGASGVIAIGRAAFAAGISFKGLLASMGPFGLIAAAIGVALGVVSLALKKSEDSAKDAKAKLDELNKSNLDALKTQISGATEEAKKFKDELEAAARAKDRIADAKLADQLATIKASDLTPDQKERAEVDVRRKREDEKRADAQKLLDEKADADAKTAQRLAQIEMDKATAEEIAAGKKARLKAAENNIPAFTGRVRSGRGADVDAMPGEGRSEQAIAAARELEEAKLAAGPDIDATIKAAEEKRKLATEERMKADEVAAASAAVAKRERDTQLEEAPYITNARKQTDKVTAAKIPLTPQQQAAQDMSDLRAKQTFPSEYRNRIASGATVDREQLGRIYPGEQFGAYTPRQTPGQSDGAKIKVDAKPLEKGLKEGNDKTRAAIDAELAKVAQGVAAQAVALTATAAATTTLGANQAAMQAAIAQMQSQISNMRTN